MKNAILFLISLVITCSFAYFFYHYPSETSVVFIILTFTTALWGILENVTFWWNDR